MEVILVYALAFLLFFLMFFWPLVARFLFNRLPIKRKIGFQFVVVCYLVNLLFLVYALCAVIYRTWIQLGFPVPFIG